MGLLLYKQNYTNIKFQFEYIAISTSKYEDLKP